jgi:hypothetical protein
MEYLKEDWTPKMELLRRFRDDFGDGNRTLAGFSTRAEPYGGH